MPDLVELIAIKLFAAKSFKRDKADEKYSICAKLLKADPTALAEQLLSLIEMI